MAGVGLRLDDVQAGLAGGHVGAPLGRILMDTGALSARDFVETLTLQARSGARLEQAAMAAGFVSRAEVVEAQARRHAALRLVRATTPPDDDLATLLPVAFCLEHGICPWARIGPAVLIATAYPERFETVRALLPETVAPVIMGVADEDEIQSILADWHRAALVGAAESHLPDDLSCRSLGRGGSLRRVPLALGAAMLALLLFDARLFFGTIAGWAALSLVAALALKIAAFVAHFFARPAAALPLFHHRPSVSLLVPLYRETGIALALVDRLAALTYPKALLDVVFVLEEDDTQTRRLLDTSSLPPYMRHVIVPGGTVRTKPRALNYALNFCRSEIIGIYDAEDAPEPGQIETVVARFAAAPPQVACLQGILDFYNPRAGWLARCFAIEYATWFRVILPGLARLGFAIPLGGTTVFFRRAVLEAVRGWDAHNVTEDADLGIRLARFGYRTEMVETVTTEEACARPWPWVRQRSRWLKGYMVTYLVHMRRPLRLWRELGAWRFFGFQVFFLSTLSQFLLAPVLWSFWLMMLGMAHPLDNWVSVEGLWRLGLVFLLSEVTALTIGALAIARTPHRGLMLWVPTMMLYFPLGSLAAYKGLVELIRRPFYWDKTSHGTAPGGHS